MISIFRRHWKPFQEDLTNKILYFLYIFKRIALSYFSRPNLSRVADIDCSNHPVHTFSLWLI